MRMPMRGRKLNPHRNFDYSLPGFYYLTICTKNRINWFGKIINETMIKNQFGQLAYNLWQLISNHYNNIELDEFIIMPNHIHGIILITEISTKSVGTEFNSVPTRRQLSIQYKNYGQISKIIKSYKHDFTRTIWRLYNLKFRWQRSFFDHVIHNQDELEHARWYIENNPQNWHRDRNNIQI